MATKNFKTNTFKPEFPQNRSNHFKIQLPHPIRFSLLDLKVPLLKLVDGNEILFTMDWIMKYPSSALKFGRSHYNPNHLRAMVEYMYIDGVSFMKSMITFFEQCHILNYQGPQLGSSYIASDGKRMKSRWDGDNLQRDNKVTHVHSNYSPALKINKMLKMEREKPCKL